MPLYALGEATPQTPQEGNYWLAPDAVIVGHILLGRDVGIWFKAVLRGDNEPIEIGPESNIQEHALLHTDPGFPLRVGARCTIGHRAILHGCTLGDQVLVGMGAIVLNGAVIGHNCLIGAGALIPQGKVIPDNSLVVGMPGKVIRSLSAEEIDGLAHSAAHYVQNWRRFQKELHSL